MKDLREKEEVKFSTSGGQHLPHPSEVVSSTAAQVTNTTKHKCPSKLRSSIVTWSSFWEPIYSERETRSSLAFPSSARKQDTLLQSQAVRSPSFSETTQDHQTETHFQLCPRVMHASGEGQPVLWKERSLGELRDWSVRFFTVLKSIILRCDR